MTDKPNIQATTRGALATRYGVKIDVLTSWIKIHPALAEICKPYLDDNKKVLPPAVIKKIIEVLGEPD